MQYTYAITVKKNSHLITRTVLYEEVCSNKWKWYNGNCYSYQDSHKASWEEARKHCKNFNGDLVTFLNEKEMKVLESLQIKRYAWIGRYMLHRNKHTD